MEDGEHDAFGIAKRQGVSRRERFGELLRDVERDRNRPQQAGRKPHRAADAVVVGVRHEAAERRKGAGREHLEIAQLSRRQIPRGPLARCALDDRGAVRIDQQIDERSTVRRRTWRVGHDDAMRQNASQLNAGKRAEQSEAIARSRRLRRRLSVWPVLSSVRVLTLSLAGRSPEPRQKTVVTETFG